MHIFFSGIGGAGIGPLAMVAEQAGYAVSGSDKQYSSYIDYLRKHSSINIHIGQGGDELETQRHETLRRTQDGKRVKGRGLEREATDRLDGRLARA